SRTIIFSLDVLRRDRHQLAPQGLGVQVEPRFAVGLEGTECITEPSRYDLLINDRVPLELLLIQIALPSAPGLGSLHQPAISFLLPFRQSSRQPSGQVITFQPSV